MIKPINVQEAITILQSNQLVAVPTDTVFGLVAKVNSQNQQKIALLKGNNIDKKYSIMVSSKKEALLLWEKNEVVINLVNKYFPGALTIIAKSRTNNDMIGIRIPDHKDLLTIIKKVGPIYATSVNLSGKTPLKTIKEINEVFPNLPIVEGHPNNKKPSTIVLVENKTIKIVRQGDLVL